MFPSSIPTTEFHSPDTSIFTVNPRRRQRQQHMNLLHLQFLPPITLPHHPTPLHSTKISCLYNPNPNPKPYSSRIRPSTPTPPRDIVIDFGKHKGKMLGSLPPSYLKWVSKNLRAGEFLKWAELADLVLVDPIYKDRIEWDYADRIMRGDSASISETGEGTADALAELAERFGWDFQGDWRKVKFELLGTSYGGRLPRIGSEPARSRVERERPAKRRETSAVAMDARDRRRERMRLKRGERASAGRSRVARLGSISGGDDDEEEEEVDENRTDEVELKRFPGRESLWKKVIDRQRLL